MPLSARIQCFHRRRKGTFVERHGLDQGATAWTWDFRLTQNWQTLQVIRVIGRPLN